MDPEAEAQPSPHFVVVLDRLGRSEEARGRHLLTLERSTAILDGPVRAMVVENAAQWCLDHGFPGQAAVALGLRGIEDTLDPEVRALRDLCVEEDYRAALARGLREPLTPAALEAGQ